MKVKSIVIDGFKSYAHRQELSQLDPHFNAITGLNGSGKSNVFDAICFVMGLRNVAKVRVERQEELIFKNGKAGIQRASVTIEFDNSDPATAPQHYSPAEYPTISITRQIDTGLRQRFFFNGRLCDQERIKEFFIHASLNIENPHFLVQQGQIHRLVGMKPSDILSFIEEAAGTLVFDHSRRKAELQMRSKEKRLTEINESLDTGIGPRLRSIEEQGKELSRWEDLKATVDQLQKFEAAHRLYEAERAARDARLRLQTVQARLAELRQAVKDGEKQLAEREQELQTLEADNQGPAAELKRLKEQEAENKKVLAKSKTQATATKKQAAKLADELRKMESDRDKAVADLERFEATSSGASDRHSEIEAEIEALQTHKDDLMQSIRLQKSGVNAGHGGVSLQEEAQTLERKRIELTGQMTRHKRELENMERNLKEQRDELAAASGSGKTQEQDLAAAKAELQRCERAYAPYAEASQRVLQLGRMLSQHQHRVTEQAEYLIRNHSLVAPLKYNKNAPQLRQQCPDMDAALRGRLGELVRAKDPQRTSTALSVGCGGGNLTKYIIARDDYAQVLLEHGRLAQRTSFWALSAVERQPSPLGNPDVRRRIEAAYSIVEEMGGGGADGNNNNNGCWAELAFELIEYDAEYRPLMERAFGSFFVCSDIELAKRIAYDQRCRFKAVTLDGDLVDPNGMMAGGAKLPNMDLLGEFARGTQQVGQYRTALAELRQVQEELETVKRGSANQQEMARTQEQLERAKQRVEELEDLVGAGGGDGGVAQLKRSIADLEARHKKATEFVNREGPQALAKIKQRTQEIEQSKDLDTAGRLKQLEAEKERSLKQIDALQKQLSAGRAEFEKQNKLRAQLSSKREAQEQAMSDKRSDLQQAKEEEEKAVEELRRVELQQSNTNSSLKEIKAKYDALCEKIHQVTRDRDALADDINDQKRSIERTTTELTEAEKSNKDAGGALDSAERHKPGWVTADLRATFGDASGPYYFADEQRTAETLEKLRDAKEAVQALSKKVQPNARQMLDRWSEEHRKLIEQRQTLVSDKQSIVDSITEVEQRKWAALDDVVRRVSEHFSALFHTCLDYATCRLGEQRDAETGRLIGLEVKVAFNGKEKASLTELSGGQRSLLALCLILSILRVHRAPVYILDEVDAALDPSHTQNLGLMLKQHFADAQFLLVSLKDGMFSSANVVYEVRNTQGFSEVTRKEFANKRGGAAAAKK